MSARRHTLRVSAGLLHVDITETATEVRFQLSGAMASANELPKFRRFLSPLVLAYEHDPRTNVVSGFGSPLHHSRALPGVGVVGWATPSESGQ